MGAFDSVDSWDYLTFGVLVLILIAFMMIFIYIGGLPGKIAMRRRHPHAETVKLMGWIGLFAVLPWIHAFIWAFHDSLTIDVRRFPKEEAKAIDEELERLGAKKDEPKPEASA
ncbi:MAG: DUF3302 domain-containing protein [Alphaproteobacteria bacterium]|nr:DUF3302 domain-containing protein [Alphaproteobacteria bacterium]